MQTLFLRVFILMFVALGIAAAHSWNSNIQLHLESQDFDWSTLEDEEDATTPAQGTDPGAAVGTLPAPDEGEGSPVAEGDPEKRETTKAEPKQTGATQPQEGRASSDPHITVEQARRLFDRQFLADGRQVIFIDARARSEFLKGHIENAISLPAGEFGAVLPAKATAWLQGSAVVIYCQGAECHDSHDVARRLQGANLDIKPIFILQAGYPAWEEAGHPTMTGPDVGWEL